MLLVPTQPLAWQVFNVSLAQQPSRLSIRQRTTGLFLDLSVNGAQIVAGRLCLNGQRLVRDAYLGFIGDLAWFDTQPSAGQEADPTSSGLGSRWVLIYLEAADIALVGDV